MTHVQAVEPRLRRRFRCVTHCNYIPPSTTSYEHTGCSGTFFPPRRAAHKTLNTMRLRTSVPLARRPQLPTRKTTLSGLVVVRCVFRVRSLSLTPVSPTPHARNALQLQASTAIPVRSTVKSLWKMELCTSLSIKCLYAHSAAIENFVFNWHRAG